MKEKRTTRWIPIAKWALVALAFVVIVTGALQNRTSGTDFKTMEKKVVATADLKNMKKADNQMIRRLYGFDPDQFDGIVLYYPKSNMNAEELLIIKLKDTKQQKMVQQAMNDRVATLKKSFKGYGAAQTAMLEKSVVKVRGNYALYVSADDPGKVKAAFDAAY